MSLGGVRRHPTARAATEIRDIRVAELEARVQVLREWQLRSVSSSVCSVLWLIALAAGFAAGKLT